MEFFKKLSELLDGADMTITIRGGEKNMTALVVVRPSSTDKNVLPPLSLNGTAEEIDQAFFSVISRPIKNSISLLIEADEIEKAAKAATAKKNAPAKKTNSAVSKEVENTESKKSDEDEPEEVEEIVEEPISRTVKLTF